MSSSSQPTASTGGSSTAPPSSSDPTKDSTTTSEPLDPERTAQARAAITKHLNAIGSSHLQPLEQRASDIQSNAVAISKQQSELEKSTKELEKERKKLDKEAEKTQDKLKELGDIQNWAEVLERDIRVLEEAVAMGEGERMEWETDEDEEASDQAADEPAKDLKAEVEHPSSKNKGVEPESKS